ncbi:hypothetical protein FMEAI12_3020004 [Parafrankia sp. Ea1.12]|nr:hypothetical protein FMEAI12_3020004 [Parafrankia sp. Ea1.12]
MDRRHVVGRGSSVGCGRVLPVSALPVGVVSVSVLRAGHLDNGHAVPRRRAVPATDVVGPVHDRVLMIPPEMNGRRAAKSHGQPCPGTLSSPAPPFGPSTTRVGPG